MNFFPNDNINWRKAWKYYAIFYGIILLLMILCLICEYL